MFDEYNGFSNGIKYYRAFIGIKLLIYNKNICILQKNKYK